MSLYKEIQQVLDRHKPMKDSDIRVCRNHAGEDCERCSGTGYRKTCRLRECIEYGCCGDGVCIPNADEIKKYKEQER